MKRRIQRIAIVCAFMLGMTSMPMGTFYAENVTEIQQTEPDEAVLETQQEETEAQFENTENETGAQLDVDTENEPETQQSEDDAVMAQPESETDASTETVENNDESAECVMNPEMTGNANLPQDVEGDYDDDPQAGRAMGNVSEDFYNEDELYGIATYSDLTGSAGIVHDSKFNGTTKRSGVDVSSWQGDIDWNQVKAAGIEYAIIRVGYRGLSSGTLAKDKKGIQNLQAAKAAGLKVGVYIFSQAISTSEAQEEADYTINQIAGNAIDLPIVIDYEYGAGNSGRLYDAHLSADAATSVVNAFCERVQSRGYYGMVYANKSMLEAQLNASDISSKYLVWLANYTNQTGYSGNYRFWQYTSTGSVPGISGNVDMDVWYDNGTLMGGGYDSDSDVSYSTHVQTIGWQNAVSNGVSAGTTGKGLRLEAIKINLGNKKYSGGITYSAHVQGIGWQNWVSNGQVAGTVGQGARLEAIRINLVGEMAKHYDVYYRVHAQNIGWMGWAKNGVASGTQGYSYRLEAIQIVIVEKGKSAPGSTKDPFKCTRIKYNTHIQNTGWGSEVNEADISGSTGKGLRLEALNIHLINQAYSGDVQYQAHIQNVGWEQEWKQNGQTDGTTGKSARVEAIRIRLTGEMAKHYDIYYRVHAQNIGWMGWTKNGQSAGTQGYSYRLEAIQIMLVDKGKSAPGSTKGSFKCTRIKYNTHVQGIGWGNAVNESDISGSTGKGLRMEALNIQLVGQMYSGNIQYQAHIQNIGWGQGWKQNGQMAGTTGKSARLEAVKIQLTGEMAKHYDIYYRVHAQNVGWMGWAKNGQAAGTEGYSCRLEAIQIVLVDKGGNAPGTTNDRFRKR